MATAQMSHRPPPSWVADIDRCDPKWGGMDPTRRTRFAGEAMWYARHSDEVSARKVKILCWVWFFLGFFNEELVAMVPVAGTPLSYLMLSPYMSWTTFFVGQALLVLLCVYYQVEHWRKQRMLTWKAVFNAFLPECIHNLVHANKKKEAPKEPEVAKPAVQPLKTPAFVSPPRLPSPASPANPYAIANRSPFGYGASPRYIESPARRMLAFSSPRQYGSPRMLTHYAQSPLRPYREGSAFEGYDSQVDHGNDFRFRSSPQPEIEAPPVSIHQLAEESFRTVLRQVNREGISCTVESATLQRDMNNHLIQLDKQITECDKSLKVLKEFNGKRLDQFLCTISLKEPVDKPQTAAAPGNGAAAAEDREED
eukprot:Sspe_Gene.67578::Locus_39871_Transcript_1_1_Confidence_1.000_Length_1534::g.67578::m.67578